MINNWIFNKVNNKNRIYNQEYMSLNLNLKTKTQN